MTRRYPYIMEQKNYQGLWPVMITPFTNEGQID